jgi:hypothetical protein
MAHLILGRPIKKSRRRLRMLLYLNKVLISVKTMGMVTLTSPTPLTLIIP